jgi:peptidoglycan hydrolase-like protein with peptidoglycan-binding domain
MKKNSNRKKIVIGSLIVFVLLLLVGYFLILSKEEKNEVLETTKNLFPFGSVNLGTRGDDSSQGTIAEGGTQQTDGPGGDDFVESLEPRLRQISDFPTGGFGSFIQKEEREVVSTETDIEGNETQNIKVVDIEHQIVRYTSIEDASISESLIKSSSIVSETIVKNLIPNAEHSFFTPDGSNIAFQYWNKEDGVIETYLNNIRRVKINIKQCPYDFSPITIGQDAPKIIGIHEFLNRNQQTQLAISGINSPGNETSLVTAETITSIKNFQSLYQIEIDGELGPSTSSRMKEICDIRQKELAKEEFDNLQNKYILSGFFLPQNIIQIATSPVLQKIFYLKKDPSGVVGFVYNFITNTQDTVFESSFTEWLTHWSGESLITLNTKPSYGASGYAYELNPETKRFFKTVGSKNGLNTLVNLDNTKMFISESTTNSVRSSILDTETNQNIPLIIQTFPEKCTWASDNITLYCAVPDTLNYRNEYPDSWYQGLDIFNDSLWKINTETLEEEVLSDISIEYPGVTIDIEKIGISPSNEYLYFIDKQTEYLWSYRLVDY